MMACGSCGDANLAGETKTNFLGFRKFTCEACSKTSTYPRTKGTHLAFQAAFVGALAWTVWTAWRVAQHAMRVELNGDDAEASASGLGPTALAIPAILVVTLLAAIMAENAVYKKLKPGSLTN